MIGNKGGIYNYWNCFKVLPTIYDDSLSYYEVLCKLTYTIDQVIKKLDTDYNEFYAYVDKKTLEALQNSKSYTDSEIDKLESHLNESIVMLIQMTNNSNEYIKEWVNEQIAFLIEWVAKHGDNVLVTNPITGELDSIQNVLNEYYNVFNCNALTCIEYDSLGLTCQDYDNKELTVIMYDYYAKKYLWYNGDLIMFHPVTGVKTCYKNVVDFLIDQHKEDCLTCNGYNEKELTTSGYDSFNLTTYDYDWHSTILL